MKILFYAAECTPNGMGSYAYQNLRDPLLRLGFDIVDFDYVTTTARIGKKAANQALEQVIQRECPDIFFHIIVEDELDMGLASRIKARSDIISMVWFSDDEWRLSHSLQWVNLYDVAFSTAPGAIDVYSRHGHDNVVLVPYACNTHSYFPIKRDKIYDVTFVGQPYKGRPELIKALLEAGIKVRVWGAGWESYPELRSIASGFLPHDEMLEVFARSRIVLGMAWCSHDGVTPQIKGRIFEYSACQAFQITNENFWLDHFFSREDLIRYDDVPDLIKKINYYLINEEERDSIAMRAYACVVAEHTWEKRFINAFKHIVARGMNKGKPLACSMPSRCNFVEQVGGSIRPRVSVVCFAFNQARYIEATIVSILNQTYTDFELIILDDGSTDDTACIVRRYGYDPRLRYVYQENIGKSLDAFDELNNRCVNMSNGDLIAFIGGDDVYEPDALRDRVLIFDQHASVDIVFSDGYFIDQHGVLLDGGFRFDKSLSFTSCNLLRTLFAINIVPHPSVMMKRAVFDKMGGFETGFAPDYHFWIKAAPFCNFHYLDKKLFRYRLHPGSASNGVNNRTKIETEHLLFDVRKRFTILDFYPELADLPNVGDNLLYAAYVDLGNTVVQANIPVLELAAQEYMNALQHFPQGSEALNNLAVISARLGNKSDAETLLNSLLKLAPCDHVKKNIAALHRGDSLHLMFLPCSHDFYRLTGMPREDTPMLSTTVQPTPSSNLLQTPFFSIILTAYNRPALAVNTLQSIAAQTFRDFELIYVNDGGVPQEALLGIVADALPAYTYVRKPNGGVGSARNLALRIARGQYIVYIDDDDLMYPQHLARLHEEIGKHPGALVFGDAHFVMERLEGGIRREVSQHLIACEHYDFNLLQVSNYIPVNCLAHPRAVIAEAGDFDEKLPSLEDWDFLIRLSRLIPFVHFAEATVQVRRREDKDNAGDSRTVQSWGGMRAVFAEIYRRYDDLGEQDIREARKVVLAAEHPSKAKVNLQPDIDHMRWLAGHALTEADAEVLAHRLIAWPRQPQITLVVLASEAQGPLLAKTLDSLQLQLYKQWRLIVVADFAAPDPLFENSEVLGWLQVDHVDQFDDTAKLFNAVLAEVGMEWGMLLPCGAQLEPHALLRFADRVVHDENCLALYCDHDSVAIHGYEQPQFKPAFDLDMLLAYDYIGASVLLRADAVQHLGGLQPYEGFEVYQLLLNLAAHFGAAAIANLPELLLHLPARDGKLAMRKLAVEDWLQARETPARVELGLAEQTLRVVYPLAVQPLVSIIIPSRNAFEFIEPCINTLFERTAYPHFEVVVVDNQSDDPDVLRFYEQAIGRFGERLRVVHYDAPFNFSAQINLGAANARGDYLLLLNNDIEIVQPDWLERMLQHAVRDGVGAVGAKLLFPETAKVQHAGIFLGGGPDRIGSAAHLGWMAEAGDAGYMNRLQIDQRLSAVSAACLLTPAAAFHAVGGFDEHDFAVLYNDVDYCLRLRDAGWHTLWTPYATLVHHHCISIRAEGEQVLKAIRRHEQNLQEQGRLLQRWLPALANDPAYNPNLSLTGKPCDIEQKVLRFWPPEFTELPRILGNGIAGGSGEYRVDQPLRALGCGVKALTACLRRQMTEQRLVTVVELQRLRCDTYVMQNAFSDPHLSLLQEYRKHLPSLFLVMSLDDLFTHVPEKSSVYKQFMANFRDGRRRLRQMLGLVDRLVVTTEPLREIAADMISDIRVVPNRLSRVYWGNVQSQRNVGRKPRVGWVGAQQHQGDLALLEEVIKATAHEVDWVFMGMWPQGLDAYIAEKHKPVSFEQYPAKMASLNLDIALAPLETLPFNEAKSNLRLLEYGVMRWPVICSDVYPYRTGEPPVTRVGDDAQAWIAQIRRLAADPAARAHEGEQLRAWVDRAYWLEDHLDEWLAAFTR